MAYFALICMFDHILNYFVTRSYGFHDVIWELSKISF